jgi:hypothetical protein
VNQELIKLCWQARAFLEPRWLTLHQSWGEAQPTIPSQYMCRYSSIFIQKILNTYPNQSWQLVAGRPLSRALEGRPDGLFGFCTASGLFFDHCWVQSADLIVDLTADQFGAETVIITSVGDPRYHPNLDAVNFQRDIDKLSYRSQQWLQEWLRDPILQK